MRLPWQPVSRSSRLIWPKRGLVAAAALAAAERNTYKAPPQTNTAPKAAPIERSMTQKGAPTTAQNTPSGAGAAAQTSRFGGWRGLLMGGLIAAGLASIFGFGALASVLGFVLQFALIAIAAYLVVAFIRSRYQPAPAHARGACPTGTARDTAAAELRLALAARRRPRQR